ncbi:MAG: MBL fold metallo-hydrolase [Thermoplasmatota archaeon]|jgi:glyoxylase-like metal-dependent hydrolase (beta-lactamase superfamily II)
MEINYIYGRNYDSNIYIINGEKPTIIDCGTGLHSIEITEEIKRIINPCLIVQIIITHEHFDHCGGVKQIYELTNKNAEVMAHIYASDKIEKSESHFAKMLGCSMPKMHVDVKLENGDILKIGDENFEVIHTPGHTPGSLCLYSRKSKSLFSGDTIFSYGSFGRYDFPEGDAVQLKNSIERLAKLDVLNIYPGHETIVEGDGNKHMKMTLQNIRSTFLL